MSWEEVLQIEKGMFSDFADRMMPSRVEERELQAFNQSAMDIANRRESERYSLTSQRFQEWANSNPDSYPNGKATRGQVLPQSWAEKQMWERNGGYKQVSDELYAKYPEPQRDISKSDWFDLVKWKDDRGVEFSEGPGHYVASPKRQIEEMEARAKKEEEAALQARQARWKEEGNKEDWKEYRREKGKAAGRKEDEVSSEQAAQEKRLAADEKSAQTALSMVEDAQASVVGEDGERGAEQDDTFAHFDPDMQSSDQQAYDAEFSGERGRTAREIASDLNTRAGRKVIDTARGAWDRTKEGAKNVASDASRIWGEAANTAEAGIDSFLSNPNQGNAPTDRQVSRYLRHGWGEDSAPPVEGADPFGWRQAEADKEFLENRGPSPEEVQNEQAWTEGFATGRHGQTEWDDKEKRFKKPDDYYDMSAADRKQQKWRDIIGIDDPVTQQWYSNLTDLEEKLKNPALHRLQDEDGNYIEDATAARARLQAEYDEAEEGQASSAEQGVWQYGDRYAPGSKFMSQLMYGDQQYKPSQPAQQPARPHTPTLPKTNYNWNQDNRMKNVSKMDKGLDPEQKDDHYRVTKQPPMPPGGPPPDMGMQPPPIAPPMGAPPPDMQPPPEPPEPEPPGGAGPIDPKTGKPQIRGAEFQVDPENTDKLAEKDKMKKSVWFSEIRKYSPYWRKKSIKGLQRNKALRASDMANRLDDTARDEWGKQSDLAEERQHKSKPGENPMFPSLSWHLGGGKKRNRRSTEVADKRRARAEEGRDRQLDIERTMWDKANDPEDLTDLRGEEYGEYWGSSEKMPQEDAEIDVASFSGYGEVPTGETLSPYPPWMDELKADKRYNWNNLDLDEVDEEQTTLNEFGDSTEELEKVSVLTDAHMPTPEGAPGPNVPKEEEKMGEY